MSRISTKLVIPALMLAVAPAALLAETPPQDQDGIMAVGQRVQHTAWLASAGPGIDGSYVVWISLSDLDLTTDAHRSVAMRRVKRGANTVCNLAVSDVHGVFEQYLTVPATRECRRDTMTAVQPQLDRVFAAIGKGERFADLTLGVRRVASAR